MVSRLRTSIIGTLGTPATEQWSINLHWAAGIPPANQEDMDDLTDSIASALDTTLGASTALRDLLTLDGSVTGVQTYYYGATGPAILQGEAPITVTGTGSTNAPFQTSMVFSLRTGLPGRSGRGRVYWPALGVDMTSTGNRVNQGTPYTELVTALSGVEDAASGYGLSLAVYSPTRDLLTLVSSIQMGNVPDVQRRRAENIAETYVSVAYPN